jgi:hypothetical protein
MKYKIGTKVKCYVGNNSTEVTGIIQDDSHYKSFVNMRGKSLVKFDKPIKMGEHFVSSTTLSNCQITKRNEKQG